MPSTTALFTALTGLNANARQIDVVGNNVANVNTTAFKSSRLLFSTMFSRTLSAGTQPGDFTGGTNPFQIGLGVATAGTQRNTTAGSISATGDQRDLAIDGGGYFIVDRAGTQVFTRAGAFRTNAANELTTVSGERLQGYSVDSEFNIVPGSLKTLTVPIGSLTLAEATRNVRFSGNLRANGDLPTTGSALRLGPTTTTGFGAIAGASPAPTAPNVLETTTRLVDIEDPLLAGSGTPLFAAGQTLQLRGAEKGGKLIPDASLDITSSTTIDDLTAFLNQALGIEATVPNPDGSTPGVSLDPLTGALSVSGNAGTVNDIALDGTDFRLLDPAGTVLRYPFTPSKSASATGESVRTTFIAYDSLGTPVTLDVSMVLDSRSNTGTRWRYFAESGDNAGTALQIGTGTIDFDNLGKLASTAPITVTMDRSGTGAVSPLTINLALSGPEGEVTSLSDDRSSLAAVYRDGSPIGTLSGFAVGADGVLTGSFSNGLTRTIGQVALATFSNPEGLVDAGNNTFEVGANSGPAVIATPGTFGAGQIVGGALELSNVDLSEEFIKLVLSSTGYSASSRVIRTTDDLFQQLLVLGR